MESHIQSWFTINPKAKNILFTYENEALIIFDNFKLGKSAVLVKVKRVGKNAQVIDSTWYHLSVNDPIRKKFVNGLLMRKHSILKRSVLKMKKFL
ncbi:MAG: hypothetical protein ACYDBT_11425 [Desulfobulbaceae bacterium]